MPIGTGDAVEKFGTPQVLESSGGAITDGNFVAAGTALAATGDVIYGSLVLDGVFAAAPGADTVVEIFLQALNIKDTTDDANAPSANFTHLKVGEFPTDAGGTGLVVSTDISLENVVAGQTYNVYLRNGAGQTLNAGWSMEFTPKAIGPAA